MRCNVKMFESFKRSDVWRDMEEELIKMEAVTLDELATCSESESQLRFLQGTIYGIRMMRELPDTLEDEAKTDELERKENDAKDN